MTVRPVSPAEVEAVAALSARCFARAWTVDALAHEVARPHACVLSWEVDGVLSGYGLAYVIAGESEVLSIAVDPERRRRGGGRALLVGLLEGCARAHLEVRADNHAALALYERFGFERVGLRRGYYADATDALVMAWIRPASP